MAEHYPQEEVLLSILRMEWICIHQQLSRVVWSTDSCMGYSARTSTAALCVSTEVAREHGHSGRELYQ